MASQVSTICAYAGFIQLYSVCPVNAAFPVIPTKPAMLQLLSSSQPQAETQIDAASQMIQEYGQALTMKDARLALEYYWQAAAVLGGTTSVKVLSHPLLHCLSVTPHHVTGTVTPSAALPKCDSTSCDSKSKAAELCCTVFWYVYMKTDVSLHEASDVSWRY